MTVTESTCTSLPVRQMTVRVYLYVKASDSQHWSCVACLTVHFHWHWRLPQSQLTSMITHNKTTSSNHSNHFSTLSTSTCSTLACGATSFTASYSWLRSHSVDSWFHVHAMTVSSLFTQMDPCKCGTSAIIWYWPKNSDTLGLSLVEIN